MDYENLLQKAEQKILALNADTEFFLKDLFEGTEWNKLKKGEKSSFGKLFKNSVDNGRFINIVYIGKAPNNSAIYKKSIKYERGK